MANKTNGNNQFRDDEITVLSHWDKKEEKWVKNVYPKIGGRLRLAHEENDQLSITSEIIKYDESLAVVRAITTTMKGSFPGIGMSSVERDHSIAPAILELAETRAIARSLRFAGYGVEYCSPEEVSHFQNGGDSPPSNDKPKSKPPEERPKGGEKEKLESGGNGEARVTNKQLSYIVNLGKSLNFNSKDLDQETVKAFGEEMETHLHFSFSQLNTYLICPAKYAHTYVWGTPWKTKAIALPYGRAIHKSAEAYYRNLMNTGEVIPVDQVIDTFTSVLDLITIIPIGQIVITSSCKGVCTWAREAAEKRGLKVNVFAPDLENIRAWFDVPKRYYERNKELVEEGFFYKLAVMESGR